MEDQDLYENCSYTYETEFRGSDSRPPVARENDYGETRSSRLYDAVNETSQHEDGESNIVKPLGPKNKDRSSHPLRTIAISMVILIILILLSAAVSVYCTISLEQLKRETLRHGAASSSLNSSRIDGNAAALQKLSLNVDRMTKSSTQSQLRNQNALRSLWSELNRVAASQRRSSSDILTKLGLIANSVDRTYRAALRAPFHVKVAHPYIRLVNGGNLYSGRVEVFYNGSWGTVCDDSWGIEDARVVCRMAGFPDAISAPRSARYGQGTGRTWLDEVQCRGTEDSIWDCSKNSWGIEDCSHSEDASVVCKL